MKEILQITSEDNTLVVKIEKGELISLVKNNLEYIHQKGAPGWRNSDTEMFPIIGPTASNNFVVETPKGNCIQDQHGLLRELNYTVVNQTTGTVSYKKEYIVNTKIKNSKYPNKSPEPYVFWPYDFSFIKKYEIKNDTLVISFSIESEINMPFMLGYHPAFLLSGNKKETIVSKNETISIDTILKQGSIAYPVKNSDTICLEKEDGNIVKIKTTGFDNFMLWTEVNNMVCIEPITKYPYTNNKKLLPEMFTTSKGKEYFEVVIDIK